jgi:hypothetical protein
MARTSKPAAPAQVITTTALTEHAAEIRKLGKRIAADVIEAGRRLNECRTILKEDGSWRAWLKNELNLSPQSAGRFIQMYKERSNLERLDLPVSSLYLLAAPSTPKAARKEIAERAKGGERIKHDNVKAVIKEHTAKKPGKGTAGAALVWTEGRKGIRAKTRDGHYRIYPAVGAVDWTVNFVRKGPIVPGSIRLIAMNLASREEAEAAALADYERRAEPADKGATKPTNALTWKRVGQRTRAKTSGGYYEAGTIGSYHSGDNPNYETIFNPKNKPAVRLADSASLKDAKALAQAHYDGAADPDQGATKPVGATGKQNDATGEQADTSGSFERWQKQAAEAALATAPGAKPTRSEILTADRWWAVRLADKEIENARKIYALLVDDERRAAFTKTLEQAIDAAGKGPEALVEVMADALGINDDTPTTAADHQKNEQQTETAEDEADATGANGNDVNPKVVEWQIKCRKYPNGWWWSASGDGKTLSCPTDVLFATQAEAQANADAAIANAKVAK